MNNTRRIAEIRERCKAATGASWIRKNGQILCPLGSGDLLKLGGGFDANDAEFVAHSREDIPYLLSEVDRLEAESLAEPEPLTVEQLSYMHGEPVYIIELGVFTGREWNLLDDDTPVDFDLQDVNFKNGDCYPTYDYGKTWLAYRRRRD